MEFWVDDLIIATAPDGVTYQGNIRMNTDTNTRYQNSCMKIVGEDGLTQGYVYIIAAMEDQVYSKVDDIRGTLLMGTGITLVIALVLSLMLAQTITKPIVDLTFRAAEIARGNFSQQIVVESDDEIGQLGQMFNSMADQLSRTLGEISNEKSKMDAIITYMSNGVIAFDTAGELIHINPRAKELLVLPEITNDKLV
jgi:two-component system sensor histidine kinase VicK